ncbi:MAG: response regulator [Deltaproteobacteria bacterium]|nr:response regulator [Deltaproteobacteria bacterium]
MRERLKRLEDRELLEEFLAESRRYLDRIASASGQIQSGQAAAAGDLIRAGHSLRGAASALGLQELADTAAAVEVLGEAVVHGRLSWRTEHRDTLTPLLKTATDYLSSLAETQSAFPDPSGLVLAATRLDRLTSQDDFQDEISELLREEARDCLLQVNSHLQELLANPNQRELLESIRRPVHTLKGSAATASFFEISELSHQLEDLLERDAGLSGPLSEERIRLFLEVSDGIEDLLKEDPGVTRTPRYTQLFAKIGAALEGTEEATEEALESKDSQALEEPQEPVTSQEPETPGESDSLSTESSLPEPETQAGAAPPEASEAPATAPPVVPTEEPVEGPAPADDASTAGSDRLLRIPARSLDDTLRVAGESLIHRATFDSHFSALQDAEKELSAAAARMKRLSLRLETEYEARALMGIPDSLAAAPGSPEFDSLEMDRYTEIHLISRELAEAVGDIDAVSGVVSHTLDNLEGFHGRMGRLLVQVQEGLGRLRLVPFSSLQSRLFRTIRVAEQATGKRADLTLDTAGVEVDKNILEELSGPLLHVLRNAVDHGIETPSQRLAAGKSRRGTVRVSAAYRGTQIEVVVTDDGRGLDLEALKAVAVQRGHLSEAEVAALSDEEAANLAFLPRLSTAQEVSQLSGRGVGLEVMKVVADRLRGSVSLRSQAGKGLELTVRLPMTLASLHAFYVTAGEETFAIPQAAVRKIQRLSEEEIVQVGGEKFVSVDGESIPLLELASHLQLPAQPELSWPRPALVVQAAEGPLVVLVDSLTGSADIVVKTLGPLLRSFRGFMGATLSGDGSVILLLDPGQLRQGQAPAAAPTPAAELPAPGLKVLVVDDSLTVRRILSRLVEARGWEAISARDGLEALELVQAGLSPNAVLLDIEMPRMDGYELTSLLRADPRYSSIPIIMLTSRAGQKHRAKAESLGVEAYLVKPYDEETLVATVRKVTGTEGR